MTNRRTGNPVKHPQWQFKWKAWDIACQTASRKGNPRLLNNAFNADIVPAPWVVTIKNLAFSGVVGVGELSCTILSDHTAHLGTVHLRQRAL